MKTLPFTKQQIQKIIAKYPTPFHIYDEEGIRKTARALSDAFGIFPLFKNFFAVKALPNPAVMKILFDEGMGMDASSYPELLLCEGLGIKGEDIMFTSNDTQGYEYEKAKKLGAVLNLDDIGHIEKIQNTIGLPALVSLRYNPGKERSKSTQSYIIGAPEEAKFGVTKDQLHKGYKLLKKIGVKRFGLHTMLASNELSVAYFVETASMLFSVIKELEESLDIVFDFVNLGGGIGIPYKPEQKALDLKELALKLKAQYDLQLKDTKNSSVKLYMENGRAITGPHGYLVTTVLHLKKTYRHYVGTDASMANLMRPGMYGAYHHITVLGKDLKKKGEVYDVVGSLCENNDKFAINRTLPRIEEQDILVIHDTGGHGHAMGFNYNGKLRSAELLLKKNGDVKLIRRAETVDDYFRTLHDL